MDFHIYFIKTKFPTNQDRSKSIEADDSGPTLDHHRTTTTNDDVLDYTVKIRIIITMFAVQVQLG